MLSHSGAAPSTYPSARSPPSQLKWFQTATRSAATQLSVPGCRHSPYRRHPYLGDCLLAPSFQTARRTACDRF